MHLMIPHASALGDACAQTIGDLALPRLTELLGLLQPAGAPLGSDEYSFHTPCEQALAALRGAPLGTAPTAAWLAESRGLAPADSAWALLTPIHLSVGSDQITAFAPEALQLGDAESRAFFELLGELLPPAEGWTTHWIAPTQWLVAHVHLTGLRSASLDRVVQRSVDAWMPEARALRTLQNEVQMLLHGSALNAAREARGELPVNSVWISGCGVAVGHALPSDVQIDARLREPLLRSDWAAWAEAWVMLDDGPIGTLLAAARHGRPARLTLCGESFAQTFGIAERHVLARLWHGLVPPRGNIAKALVAL